MKHLLISTRHDANGKFIALWKRVYIPELRSIPLTHLDCPYLQEKFWLCGKGFNNLWYQCGCKNNRNLKRCPEGYQ